MTTEYGVFNDEGCVERQLWTLEAASRAAAAYDEDDEVRVEALCPEHDEEPAAFCEECHAEDEEDKDDD